MFGSEKVGQEEGMEARLVRFGVSMDERLLQRFDILISGKGYANRSEAVRDLIRNHLVEKEWREKGREMVGIITMVYGHHTRGLADTLTDLQHRFHDLVVSTMHLHLDEDNCLEVLVIKGMVDKIRTVCRLLFALEAMRQLPVL